MSNTRHGAGINPSSMLPQAPALPPLVLSPSSRLRVGNIKGKRRGGHTTGKRVANAVTSCLDHASALAPELLSIGIEIADYGYVPGLSGIARRLLEIWRAIEQVQVNRNDALRLAGRCADILNCLKADINRNGERVPTSLELPIQRLEDTLDIIHHCMEKHIRRALIVQYLRKNSISRDISYCGSLLDDAMILISFGLGLIFQQSSIDNRNTLKFRDTVDRGDQSPIIA
ncbi:hypothetical protein BJ165DRAFT_1613576 [Panaeolus papilionaceus]|nr:hypothetical protein BJ165DRAFT_1613576 [Panaeolus papilionaceus]